jgi:hypothetical protein
MRTLQMVAMVALIYFLAAVLSLFVWAYAEDLIFPPGQGGFFGVRPPTWWRATFWPIVWLIRKHPRITVLRAPFQQMQIWGLIRHETNFY